MKPERYSSGLRGSDDYALLLHDVSSGHIEPGQALLAAVVSRARLDASGNVDPPPGGGYASPSARAKLQRTAQLWLASPALRRVWELLELPCSKITEMTEAIR